MKKYILTFIITLICTVNVVSAERKPSAQELPDKTIIIGRHIIALEVLNEELLQIALESAEKEIVNGESEPLSKQEKIYFKSDISKGTWYNITGRTRIDDISVTTDNLVTNQEIDKIIQTQITHYTKNTGETIEFKTNKIVSVSDIVDITNPKNMPELDELQKERDMHQSSYDVAEDNPRAKADEIKLFKKKIESIDNILEEINILEINELEKQISSIEGFMNYMYGNNADEEDITLIVKQKMNMSNEKKALCYQEILDRIDKEIQNLNTNDYYDLIQKYSSAKTNIQTSLSDTGVETESNIDKDKNDMSDDSNEKENQYEQKKKLSPINTIMDKYAYEMMENAKNRNYSNASKSLNNLKASNNIKNGIVKDKDSETPVAGEIKIEAKNQFEEMALKGESDEYKQAKEYGESQVTLNKLKQDCINEYKDALSQLNNIDEYILKNLSDNLDKKIEILKNTKEFFDNIALPKSDILQEVNNIVDENVIKLDSDMNNIYLETLPEYQETKKAIEISQNDLNNLNEQYLGAIEQKDTKNAEIYKLNIDSDIKKLILLEEKMEKIKEDNIYSNNENSNNKDSNNKDSNNENTQNQTDDKNNKENTEQEQSSNNKDNQNSEQPTISDEKVDDNNNSNSYNTETENLYETEIFQLPKVTATLVEEQNGKYTDEEKVKILEDINLLKNKYKNYKILEPWTLIFTDYNIKLNSPPIKIDEVIYIPLKELTNQMGAQVIKSKIGERTIIKDKGVLIEYEEKEKEIYINDKKFILDITPSFMFSNKIYVPLLCIEKAYLLQSSQEGSYTIVSKR